MLWSGVSVPWFVTPFVVWTNPLPVAVPVLQTVTVPVPAERPRVQFLFETAPPPVMWRVPPPPLLPRASGPLFVQFEPAPFTVTSPLLPGFVPIALPKLPPEPPVKTCPALEIVSVPVPLWAMLIVPFSLQEEPTPSTVTVPVEVASSPTDVVDESES